MTFLLVTAHNTKKPLPSLLAEFDSISESLRPLAERRILGFEFKVNATHQDIIKLFARLAGTIEVFHFSGHANGKRLDIAEGGQIRGMSEFFGLDRPPRLVFLNGCATIGQVKALHQVGVVAVIATNYPVQDTRAYWFAHSFYQYWVQEGNTLEKSLDFASAAIHGMDGYTDLTIEKIGRYIDSADALVLEQPAWGIFLNPNLSKEEEYEVYNWQLNPTPVLPPLDLARVVPQSRESLRKLALAFLKTLGKNRADKDPILVLIERLPWIVGTHLRRLFAVETGKSEPENNLERLKDIDCAYVELLRFLNTILLSMLWDQQKDLVSLDKNNLPKPIANQGEIARIDYLSNIRTYLHILEEIPGDHLELEKNIRAFLNFVDGDSKLFDGHKLMAELHLALYDPSPQRLHDLLINRKQTLDDVNQLCLDSEAIYASFLQATLFLTHYRLLSIWSISVDRVKFIDTQEPYAHKIIDLHGAFGEIQSYNTNEQSHGDSYCIVLVPRLNEADISLNAPLNLSPFYIDKNAFLSNQPKSAYPSIFALQHQHDQHTFLYTYIDHDRNFKYQNKANQELFIDEAGAVFPKELKISLEESQKFALTFEQLTRLQKDFIQP